MRPSVRVELTSASSQITFLHKNVLCLPYLSTDFFTTLYKLSTISVVLLGIKYVALLCSCMSVRALFVKLDLVGFFKNVFCSLTVTDMEKMQESKVVENIIPH